jgi:hypothetical protein
MKKMTILMVILIITIGSSTLVVASIAASILWPLMGLTVITVLLGMLWYKVRKKYVALLNNPGKILISPKMEKGHKALLIIASVITPLAVITNAVMTVPHLVELNEAQIMIGVISFLSFFVISPALVGSYFKIISEIQEHIQDIKTSWINYFGNLHKKLSGLNGTTISLLIDSDFLVGKNPTQRIIESIKIFNTYQPSFEKQELLHKLNQFSNRLEGLIENGKIIKPFVVFVCTDGSLFVVEYRQHIKTLRKGHVIRGIFLTKLRDYQNELKLESMGEIEVRFEPEPED